MMFGGFSNFWGRGIAGTESVVVGRESGALTVLTTWADISVNTPG
jgi:hypothetical protein